MDMTQATCRLPPVLDEVLDEAVEEAGVFRSDLVRRALVLYMRANPDEIGVFARRELPAGFVGGGMGAPARSGASEAGTETNSTYDPVEDL